ncbi:MAG: cache domain-containing protein [Bacteroidales bacterium]|nr:cache domain-containing protein [Bacteroidales bacterium]
MKNRISIRDLFAIALAAVSAVLLVASVGGQRSPGDTRAAANHTRRIIERRMAVLEGLVHQESKRLPEDMVVYTYVNDSLYSWRNQFPLTNDDINTRLMFQIITNPALNLQSPLIDVSTQTGYFNLGPKWYLLKAFDEGGIHRIAGLEILNTQDDNNFNGINPRLRLGKRFAIHPISDDGGTVVEVDGKPQFRILYESLEGASAVNAVLLWMALGLFLCAAILFLAARPTLRRFAISVPGILATCAAMFFWGRSAQGDFEIFSPGIYAGSPVLYSIGAVIILNLAILLVVLCLYIIRDSLYRPDSGRGRSWALLAGGLLGIAGILAYTHFTLRSIILNSNISLELYNLEELSPYTGVIYVSFLAMLTGIPMLVEVIRPALQSLLGKEPHPFSVAARSVFAVLVAAYFVVMASALAFRKEGNRLEVSANRLSIDRDITLELQLLWAEQQIAEDVFISALSTLNNSTSIIQNRIADLYLPRVSQNYRISVYLLGDWGRGRGSRQDRRGGSRQPDNDRDRGPGRPENSPQFPPEMSAAMMQQFNARLRGGTPIADNTRFVYINTGGGHSRYDALFYFLDEDQNMTRMILEVEPRSIAENKGYASIFGLDTPGRVTLPDRYSYARYKEDDIQLFHGDYPYPTQMDARQHERVYVQQLRHETLDGYNHFFYLVDADEAVILSRPRQNWFNYIVATILIALLFFLLLSLPAIRRERPAVFEKSYYRSRITWVLMTSLILTLVVMATVSVLFVYRRNENNMRRSMSEKINSIQGMTEEEMARWRTSPEMWSQNMVNMLDRISNITASDITLYAPNGRMTLSNTPEVFSRMLLGSRINEEAFDQIINQHKRYYIHPEQAGSKRYYCLYAPIIDENGEIVSIICSPYTGGLFDFERDAVWHSVTILTVFLLLLILAIFATGTIVDRMFKPLSEISRKMSETNIDRLEFIRYDRDDEIASLVRSYNRMVAELSDNARKLAQAERDKAWSGMARQVAHEIKNPLTPMKLQIQRIIRMKAKNDPNWQEKLDEASKVLLDHIDILTETANEFSTFAKLYTEEPTQIDLDKVLQEEISMFDNKDNVKFDYYGLKGTVVSGPKPQLTRVFVNIINNAVQAVEETPDARVVVSLRKSSADGYYDIVVEDNGPGVSDENVEKLFTPNFTTKNGGSGLGLAISRSILERCNATISYSRSFSLGGACFTIRYPMPR